jgi:hypothetical protein
MVASKSSAFFSIPARSGAPKIRWQLLEAEDERHLIMNESEVAKTYSIDLPGQEKGRGSHLRIIH